MKRFIFGIILISYLIGIYLYPSMPNEIASHWNIQGEVNGYMPKFWALFLMPMLLTLSVILYQVIPKIDPLKKNIEKFHKQYDLFIFAFTLFMFYMYVLSVLWNLNVKLNITQLMIPALATLIFYTGSFLKSAQRNWFIGIRTPWTLSNDKVWQKTHNLGGTLFMACGIITLFALFLDQYFIQLVLVPILSSTIILVIYSYVVWRKLKK